MSNNEPDETARRKLECQRSRERQRKLAASGLCVSCGKTNDGTYTKCAACREKLKASYAVKQAKRVSDREKRNARGFCVDCGKQPPKPLRRRCQDCLDKIYQQRMVAQRTRGEKGWGDTTTFYERKLKKSESLLADGLCARCGKDSVLPALIARKNVFGSVCLRCYFRKAASARLGSETLWEILERKWNEQDSVCPYTKTKMSLGIDASVDHIFPVSRFPELKADAKNVEWVRSDVNLMKSNRTKDEFIALLKLIHGNMDVAEMASCQVAA